jgi:hypothetical protein
MPRGRARPREAGLGEYVRLARAPLTVTAVVQVALWVLVAAVNAPVFPLVRSPPSRGPRSGGAGSPSYREFAVVFQKSVDRLGRGLGGLSLSPSRT